MGRRLESIAHRLGFTRSEAVAVVFLTTVISCGAVITAIRPVRSGGDYREVYRVQDSVFAARSALGDVRQSEARPSGIPAAERASAGMRAAERRDQEPAPPAAGINVNTAGPSELERLPGVGPATAAKIVQSRTLEGPFRSADDLLRVPSIGPKKLERMRPFIRVQ